MTGAGYRRARWRRECGCDYGAGFGQLPTVDLDWQDGTGLPLNKLPVAAAWLGGAGGRTLCSWGDYYASRRVDTDSPVALLLSFVLTAYHAIATSGLLESPEREPEPEPEREREPEPEPERIGANDEPAELVVHYLGPEKELDCLGLFAELALLLPASRLRIVMVGPEIPAARHSKCQIYHRAAPIVGNTHVIDDDVYGLGTASPCATVVGVGPGCEITLLRALYHEVDWSVAFPDQADPRRTPDLVLGLNAGLAAYDSYNATAALLVRLRCPCYLTDFSAEACRLSLAVLAEHGKATAADIGDAAVWTSPFPCPRVEKSGEASYDLPSFGNAFAYGLRMPDPPPGSIC